MNIILDAKSRIYKQTNSLANERSNAKNFGFAIKLSKLEKYGISISFILENSNHDIIIDAEHHRLDLWLIEQLEIGCIKESDLSKISITVQAKRFDAEEQLINLQNLNVSLVLVAGHADYLKDDEIKRSGVQLLAKYYKNFTNIRYLGISAKIHKKLNNLLDYNINDNQILELYGDHKLMKSSLWIYWVGMEISDEARNYINRRKNNGIRKSFVKTMTNYCIQNKSQLNSYTDTRSLYIYIDVKSENYFLQTMQELSE